MKCLLCKENIDRTDLAGKIVVGNIEDQNFKTDYNFNINRFIHFKCVHKAIQSMQRTKPSITTLERFI